MASAKDNIASVNESTLDVITTIQQRIVEAQQQFAEALADIVPEMPSGVPTPNLPDAPDPRELLEESFAFQARLLEANKAFSIALMEAWDSASEKATTKSSQSKASKSAKK